DCSYPPQQRLSVYTTTFSPICISRAAAAGTIFPKLVAVRAGVGADVVVEAFGLFGFTWFGMLNASARNCMDCFSPSRNTRDRPMSILILPGPTMLRVPRFPYDPVAG